jgi:hypothetical protein
MELIETNTGYVSQSPIIGFQVLCKTRVDAALLAVFVLISKARTNPKNSAQPDWTEVCTRLMPTSNVLSAVVLRQPKAHIPHAHVPEYILIHVIEHLECGHKLTVYPQADPLIARRRLCPECSGHVGALPLVPKKPVQSVRFPAPRKEAA